MGYEHNLLVESSSNIVVGPNNLDRNPAYTHGNAERCKNTVIFRDCQDCTIQGLHLTNVYHCPAAMHLERCRRMNISGCSILDCDGIGLWLQEVHPEHDQRVPDTR